MKQLGNQLEAIKPDFIFPASLALTDAEAQVRSSGKEGEVRVTLGVDLCIIVYGVRVRSRGISMRLVCFVFVMLHSVASATHSI